MVLAERRASGLQALQLETHLLRRARLADPDAGIWEAADLQWWWRMPRRSDEVEQLFWHDGTDQPVAAVVLTEWRSAWGCDILGMPAEIPALLPGLLERAVEHADAMGIEHIEMLARDDDAQLRALIVDAGFTPSDERSGITWMRAADRLRPTPLPDGFVLVDRARQRGPHPMERRSGDRVEARLSECELYDPELDIAVETKTGRIAGYALFWFDPSTGVGLVEPMRIEDEYQRRGLGRALLTAGLDRLAERGAHRLKVGFSSDAALRFYRAAGFRVTSTMTTYRRNRHA
jgi:GNAT superfamily N-acetyltransferase